MSQTKTFKTIIIYIFVFRFFFLFFIRLFLFIFNLNTAKILTNPLWNVKDCIYNANDWKNSENKKYNLWRRRKKLKKEENNSQINTNNVTRSNQGNIICNQC